MKKDFQIKLIHFLILSLLAGSSWSQVPSLPGSVQPAQVGRAIKSEQPSVRQQVLPPMLTEKEPQQKALSAQAQKIKFQLNKIILVGNHVYSTKQLEFIYAKYVGKTISVADLFGIVQSITNYYRNNGYILSRAILPPQHVKNGVVKIQIIEGYIGKVDVSGQFKGAKCIVQAFGEKIRECPPLEISRMEKYMLLTNEIPGTTVKAVLAPSKTQTGAADLTLVTETRPFMGYVSYDNYGTLYIGPQQMTANIQANSMLVSGDSSQFTIVKTPKGQELTYLDANYNMPVNAEGVRWLLGGTRVKTHPLFFLTPAEIDGLSVNYYTTLFFPAIRKRSESLTYRAGFNYLNSPVTAIGTPLYSDSLRSLDLGLTYNFADRYAGSNLFSADIRQGLPIWGYSSNSNIQTATTSRPGGRGDYTKFMMTFSRLQAIKGPISLYGIIQGQYAFSALLAEEQYTFGGPILGRGYDVAELIGDKGLSGGLELRYDRAFEKILQNIQAYIFYDAGAVWNYYFVGGTPIKQSATSAGIGMRFNMTKYISGNVMWAQPLTRQVAAEALRGQGKHPRVFFSVVASV